MRNSISIFLVSLMVCAALLLSTTHDAKAGSFIFTDEAFTPQPEPQPQPQPQPDSNSSSGGIGQPQPQPEPEPQPQPEPPAASGPDWKRLPAACLPWRAKRWQEGKSESQQEPCHCPPTSYCPSTIPDYLSVLGAYQTGLSVDGQIVNSGALSSTKLPPTLFARCCPRPVCPAGTTLAGTEVPTSGDCNPVCAASMRIFSSQTTNRTFRVNIPRNPAQDTSGRYPYVNTCRNITFSGLNMSAECRRNPSGWNNSSVANVSQCVGIENNNGNLVCDRDETRPIAPNNQTVNITLTELTNTNACDCPIGSAPVDVVISPAERANMRIKDSDGNLTPIPATMNSYRVCNAAEVWVPQAGDGGGSSGDGGGGADGGGDCLSGEAQLVRADGTFVPLADVKVGEEVISAAGDPARVTLITRTEQAKPPVFYRINQLPFRITGNHPLKTTKGWRVIDPEVDATGKHYEALEVGDVLVGKESKVKVERIDVVPLDDDKGAYNFGLEGDVPLDIGGVSIKPVKNIEIGY